MTSSGDSGAGGGPGGLVLYRCDVVLGLMSEGGNPILLKLFFRLWRERGSCCGWGVVSLEQTDS